MLVSYQITLDKRKAKSSEAFLHSMEGIEVEKHQAGGTTEGDSKEKKAPEFKYFGTCPEWEMDAAELRKRVWTSDKGLW